MWGENMEIYKPYTREQAIARLIELYEKGYRYVVRDKDMGYLTCFSIKPRKYKDIEAWGYVDPDVPKALMAYPIGNTDIAEINWSIRSATLIAVFLDAY